MFFRMDETSLRDHFCHQPRHLNHLAHKIGEVWFSTKIQTENVFFGKTNSRGLLRQNWAKFSSGTILPPNVQSGAGFIKKFQPKTCFLGWTKLHSGTLLPPIVQSGPVDTGGKILFLNIFLFIYFFPWSWPPFGECCVWSLSLFRFEIRVVCVWELVYVCACEHKFGVATNHGKF